MKYICEFAIPKENNENRYYTLSSNDKLSYIISALNYCGEKVEVISSAWSLNKSGIYKTRTDKIDENNSVVSGATFGACGKIGYLFQRIWSLVWLTFYLLFNCKKNETIFVYHSVAYSLVLRFLKKFKKIKYILEVEELFYDLQGLEKDSFRRKTEEKLINGAEAYIFASKQLEEKCNLEKKTFTLVNGKYDLPEKVSKPYDDGKIHLVYAGLIESGKVAFKSAEIARYLSEKYIIHIIGYGKQTDIDELCELISEINDSSKCKVFYDGIKRGTEYNAYLQKCHFGLCPLVADKRFQTACFPSKITSYLSNGLQVITTENAVIKTSAYGELVVFAEDDSPQNFAKAITSNEDRVFIDPTGVIKQLDLDFKKELTVLIRRSESAK